MARMLGRYRHLISCGSTRCRHCAEDGTTRWRKRTEQRELQREFEAELRDAAERGETVDLGSFAQYADDEG
jgi:hypothetical protein